MMNAGDNIDYNVINETLWEYASLISDYNKITNITGFNSIEAIYKELIVKSITPLQNLNVPRGTTFVDIGTGAGIPGLALLLYFHGMVNGLLIDSNNKKIQFVKEAVKKFDLHNYCTIIHGRAEDLAHDIHYREKFDFVISRAFAHPYMAIEYGLPFVKVGGFYYIYYQVDNFEQSIDEIKSTIGNGLYGEYRHGNGTDKKNNTRLARNDSYLMEKVLQHAEECGGHLASQEELMKRGLQGGLVVIKDKPVPLCFPRKNAVVKRIIQKLR